MSDRTPAGDKGTADRIEADDGGYWVRLVTKQAMRREGECMQNCLRRGAHSEAAGDEEMVSSSIWSLRKADGVSYLTVEVDIGYDEDDRSKADIDQAEGPMKSQPSSWSIRQIRHLVVAFLAARCELKVPERFALTDADGMTWRPDRAPDHLRLPYEERLRREAEERERRIKEFDALCSPHDEMRLSRVGDGPRFIVVGGGASRRVAAGVDTQVERRAPPVSWGDTWVEWSEQPLTSDRIQIVEVDGPAHAVEFEGTITYYAPPIGNRVELCPGHVPRPPEPTLQQRLMTGFSVAGAKPEARAREPPVPARDPDGFFRTRYATGAALTWEYAQVQAIQGRIIGPGGGVRRGIGILGEASPFGWSTDLR